MRRTQHTKPFEGQPAVHWSLGVAFLTATFWPAKTAKRTAHASLPCLWLFHFLAAVLVIMLVMLLVAWSKAGAGVNVALMIVEFENLIRDVGEELRRHPIGSPLVVVGVGLAIEAAFLGIALLVMPWGARDEPIRKSYRNALRQTWVRTAHLIPVVLLVGTMGVVLHRVVTDWRRANPGPVWPTSPPVVRLPPDDPSYQQATADYQVAMQRYNKQLAQGRQDWSTWRGRQPWYIEYAQPLVMQAGFVMAVWLLCGLLRGVGAFREVPPIARPPMCEACGYNLTTIPFESRCPECGEPVLASLGPDARPGTIWRRRREVGRWAAWWRCCRDAIRKPRALGRQLRLTSPGSDHRRFLLMHLPIIFLAGALSMPALYTLDTGRNPLTAVPEVILFAAPVFGCVCAVGALALALFAAAVVGVAHGTREKRNLIAGSMQVASYLGCYLAMWVVFGAISGLVVVASHKAYWFHALEALTGVHRDMLSTMTWLLPNVACGIGYLILVARGTEGTRYANT